MREAQHFDSRISARCLTLTDMTMSDVRDLLLAPGLELPRIAELLAPYGLTNFEKADASLQATAGDAAERLLLAKILPDLMECVADSANPDQALSNFESFSRASSNKAYLFTYLFNWKQALEVIVKSLGGSTYLSEILIRDPHIFYWVTDPGVLQKPWSKKSVDEDITRALTTLEEEGLQLRYLRSAKRREMLRIGMRDLLRLAPVEETSLALSELAEALISATYRICNESLRRTYKVPLGVFGDFTVLAMGKLGGGELRFSSDVDLMFLYASHDEKTPEISEQDYFRLLAQRISMELSTSTDEGYVYRVDLRSRPEGDAGNFADPLDRYEQYFRTKMGAWARLALLKAWPVAGSQTLGKRFLKMSRAFVVEPAFDSKALAEVREMKARTDRNLKLGAGSIREIELIVQSLQATYGVRIPHLLDRNTLRSLANIHEALLIDAEEFELLRNAYHFLCDLENKLQMVDDAQPHSVSREMEDLRTCARLLEYQDADSLIHACQNHTNHVRRLFDKYVGGKSIGVGE
jgi:[glutamine synthetase] adenylyltransferase / [glutamine synthetase]-adenylyl-L-tyrosine phosphorylase